VAFTLVAGRLFDASQRGSTVALTPRVARYATGGQVNSSYERSSARLTLILDVVALLDIAILLVAVAALAARALPR
jgi:hypothetical protein